MSAPEGLRPGLACSREFLVADQHAADVVGSGDVHVLATPAMIAFVESTAASCVAPYMPAGQTTVGYYVEARHLRPAPIGARVVVEVTLEEVRWPRLRFRARVTYDGQVIGEVVHERSAVDREGFLGRASCPS